MASTNCGIDCFFSVSNPDLQDMLEVRCLERLELQGKRMEEVAKRMEHLEDSNKSTLLQAGLAKNWKLNVRYVSVPRKIGDEHKKQI